MIIYFENRVLSIAMISSQSHAIICNEAVAEVDLSTASQVSASYLASGGWAIAPYVPNSTGPIVASKPSDIIPLDANPSLQITVARDESLSYQDAPVESRQGIYFHDSANVPVGNLVVTNRGGLLVCDGTCAWYHRVLNDGTLSGNVFIVRDIQNSVASISTPTGNPVGFSTKGFFRNASTAMISDSAPLSVPQTGVTSLTTVIPRPSSTLVNEEPRFLSPMGDSRVPIHPNAFGGTRIIQAPAPVVPNVSNVPNAPGAPSAPGNVQGVESDLFWERIKSSFDHFKRHHKFIYYMTIFLIVVIFVGVIIKSISDAL
jgi:hypothetical protein